MTGRRNWIEWAGLALLACGAGVLAVQLRESSSRNRIFEPGEGMERVEEAPGSPAAPPASAAQYQAISDRVFFDSAARPAPEPAALPAPEQYPEALPQLFGIADLGGGPSALLSVRPAEPARWISAGESIGEYQLREIRAEALVFSRGGRVFEASPAELREGRRSPARPPVRSAAAPPRRPRASRRQAGVSSRPPASEARYEIGAEFLPGRFAADASDGAPNGTVYGGYVRRVRETPFGSQHWWERRSLAGEQGAEPARNGQPRRRNSQ